MPRTQSTADVLCKYVMDRRRTVRFLNIFLSSSDCQGKNQTVREFRGKPSQTVVTKE